ncbi:hypothetical protein [Paenibacillus pabuli]|uniref:hypothetical protein n=1 Tax=Paenibacillus pabuli TaxID=1472 RepID=UPI003CEC0938
MADKIKQLIHPLVPTTSTTAYTVPEGKYTVVKSIVINNINSSDLTFTLRIGGAIIANNRKLKGNDTLVLNDLDVPLLPFEGIIVQSSNISCVMYISGYERNYSAVDYPYAKVNAITSSSESRLTWDDSDMMIKSIIIHNSNGSGDTGSIVLVSVGAPWYFIANKAIKSKDTVIIPNINLFLGRGTGLTYKSDVLSAYITVILEKVVQ